MKQVKMLLVAAIIIFTIATASIGNTVPVANAGENQIVSISSKVKLNGSASYDVDNDRLTYSWSFISKPVESISAALSRATAKKPGFRADADGSYVIELVVYDGIVDSGPDILTVKVGAANIPPIADVGADQNVEVNQTVTIIGSGTDSDGNITAYEWTTGSTVLATTPSFSYTPDIAGTDILTLTVTDNNGSTDSDSMSMIVTAVPVLKPWIEKSWYWSYRDMPVLLLGGSDDDNLFQWSKETLLPQLDRLVNAGGNVIRNTMSDRNSAEGFEVYPFYQQEDGKYDLNQWNNEYWERFERLLSETVKRGIIVQIEIWDRFDYSQSPWELHPYNPKNNINYTFEQSGFAEVYPDLASLNKQPFFFTTPDQQNNTTVLQYQKLFVDKMLDHTLQYDHVIYCINNESSGEEEWSRYWAKYVQTRAGEEGRQVFLTEMWDDWDLTAAIHKRTFDNPAELYNYVDVSQNNHKSGQEHWDNFIYAKEYLSGMPRPMNSTKTYGADGDRFGDTQDGIERVWRLLLAGAASIRFHRPTAGLGLNDKAVAAIRAARKLESIIPLWSVEPKNELLFGREENEAYLAVDAYRQSYAVYFPVGGEVKIDVSAMNGSLVAHWIDIDSGEWGPTQNFDGGDMISVAAPGQGNWAVSIMASTEPPSLTDR